MIGRPRRAVAFQSCMPRIVADNVVPQTGESRGICLAVVERPNPQCRQPMLIASNRSRRTFVSDGTTVTSVRPPSGGERSARVARAAQRDIPKTSHASRIACHRYRERSLFVSLQFNDLERRAGRQTRWQRIEELHSLPHGRVGMEYGNVESVVSPSCNRVRYAALDAEAPRRRQPEDSRARWRRPWRSARRSPWSAPWRSTISGCRRRGASASSAAYRTRLDSVTPPISRTCSIPTGRGPVACSSSIRCHRVCRPARRSRSLN